MDTFTQQVRSMNKSNLISHSQNLKASEQREKHFLMGGDGSADPIYDIPKQSQIAKQLEAKESNENRRIKKVQASNTPLGISNPAD